MAKLNEHSCLKGLTISLYDSDEKVRFVAVNALHRQGEEGTNILNEESEKLEQKGYMEAKDLLAKSAVLYSEVKKWAIETSIKYPDEIFGVYNRVYLSEVEPHRYEHDLTNYELQKMSSELRKEGFYVYDSKLPDEGSYRGFSIRRTAPY